MITRKFDKKWEQKVSSINNRIENNVIFDFFDYITDIHKDLKALKKDYEKDFNRLSKKKLSHYVKLFDKYLDMYATICIKDHKETGSIGHIQSFEDFNDGIIKQNANSFEITDKYYPVLKKIAESIFKIEDEIAPVVEMLWQKEFTNIENYSKNGNYFLLAHSALSTKPKNELNDEFREYLQAQNGMCFSLITDKKTRLYNGPTTSSNYYAKSSNGYVGIIARPKKNGIIGISFDDMLSTEYIDGKCVLNQSFDHSNINTCYEKDGSKICCRGTKICPPKEIFNISVDTINEIILDKSKMEVQAVFYVKNSKDEIPENFEAYKKEQEKLCGHKLKTIELIQHNTLNQVNLDEMYNNFY
ncbi:MAG TPA: hypothetical protein DCO89_01075 [Clostridiales bacterium]|nr:hypothetical protein [Clostridiales bacterium]